MEREESIDIEKILELVEGISFYEWKKLRECIDREFNSQADKTRFIKRDSFIENIKFEFTQ